MLLGESFWHLVCYLFMYDMGNCQLRLGEGYVHLTQLSAEAVLVLVVGPYVYI